jgi:DNA-binding CsgD family transcriptional regulator
MSNDPFTGPDRLEIFAPLGRDMRMGASAAAGVTDQSRVEEALALGRTDEASRLIDMLVADHRDLLGILGEWSLQLPGTLLEEGTLTTVGPACGRDRFTPRENEVLHWLREGKRNSEIGTILGVSGRTVEKHLEHLFQKLGVETRTAAVRAAMEREPRNH